MDIHISEAAAAKHGGWGSSVRWCIHSIRHATGESSGNLLFLPYIIPTIHPNHTSMIYHMESRCNLQSWPKSGVPFINRGSIPNKGRYTAGGRAMVWSKILQQGVPPPQQCHIRAGSAGMGFLRNLKRQLKTVLARQNLPRQGGYRLWGIAEEDQ